MQAGEAIKKVRTQTGLTQAELADRLGVTPQVISQYERGLKNPKIETIQRIADALNVSPQELLGSASAWAETVAADTIELIRNGKIQNATDNSIRLESSAKENARRLFYELPDDWHRDTAVNWQIEILHEKMGKNYNSAMFEALMQLYQDNEPFTQNLAERIESLVYGQQPQQPASTSSADKEPIEK